MNARRAVALLPDLKNAALMTPSLERFTIEQRLKRQRAMVVPTLAELEAMDDVANQFVYFVRCSTGPIKIGTANDVADRVSCLQVGCPYQLELLGTIRGGARAERALHMAFEPFRFRGEWFGDAPEIKKAVRGLLGIDDQGRNRQ